MRWFPLALLALPFGVVWSASAQTNSVIADADSYAIYALLLPSDTPVALLEETRRGPACPGGGQVTSEWKELHDSFQAANATTHTLMPQMFDGARSSIEFVSVQRLLGLIRAVDPNPDILHGDHAVYQSFPGEKAPGLLCSGIQRRSDARDGRRPEELRSSDERTAWWLRERFHGVAPEGPEWLARRTGHLVTAPVRVDFVTPRNERWSRGDWSKEDDPQGHRVGCGGLDQDDARIGRRANRAVARQSQ